MDLDFVDGTAAAEAGAAIAAVERQGRERFPMIKRRFIEAGAAPGRQRWSRPDSTQAPNTACQLLGPAGPTCSLADLTPAKVQSH